MQTKSISKLILSKIDEWIGSINDTELRHELTKCVLVSGGSVASSYLNEKVNDFDVYLTDRAVLIRLVEYYTKPFRDKLSILDGDKRDQYLQEYEAAGGDPEKDHNKRICSLRNLKPGQVKIWVQGSLGGFRVVPEKNQGNQGMAAEAVVVYAEDGNTPIVVAPKKYQPLYFSPNAISLSDDLQIVNRFWGTAEEIHKTFDFIHATNYWVREKGVVINVDAVESLLTKQLKYQGSMYPVTSIIRTKKFLKRGFNISAGEMLKMIYQASMLDLQNMDVLEEQLIGVDVAYFEMLISALRDHQDRNPGAKIDPHFFATLIDRIFNNFNDEGE